MSTDTFPKYAILDPQSPSGGRRVKVLRYLGKGYYDRSTFWDVLLPYAHGERVVMVQGTRLQFIKDPTNGRTES